MWEVLVEAFMALLNVCLQHIQREGATADDRRVGIGCIVILLAIPAAICLIVFFCRN